MKRFLLLVVIMVCIFASQAQSLKGYTIGMKLKNKNQSFSLYERVGGLSGQITTEYLSKKDLTVYSISFKGETAQYNTDIFVNAVESHYGFTFNKVSVGYWLYETDKTCYIINVSVGTLLFKIYDKAMAEQVRLADLEKAKLQF